MSLYIKRQWPKILGLAAPFFILVLLVGLGVSIFPNSNLYGLPGQFCTFGDLTNCDPCNGEVCNTFNTMVPPNVCINFPNGTANADPNIPNPQCPGMLGTSTTPNPDCWNVCNRIPSGNSTIQDSFECLANDQFCQDISGGDASNDCRLGVCTNNSTFDPANPTGCDFDYDGQNVEPLCMNCEDAAAADFNNCGNGVCEVDEGEDCQSCANDCLVPGFEDACPVTGMVGACLIGIVFPGPPYNDFGEPAEDGDLCTNSACNALNGEITNSPKSCSIDTEDFCCPAGCQAPPDGLTCGEADAQGLLPRAECDVDCYIPEMCFMPIPTPTPTPTPPLNNDFVTGSGILPCSLQRGINPRTSTGLLSLLSLGVVLAGLLTFRRQAGRH